MDQRASVAQDIKDILETRQEISRKIQLIDEKARYELENMKTSLSDLAGAVAETGKEFFDQSAQVMNQTRRMNAGPWAALAGVVLVGVVIGVLEKRFRGAKVYPYYPPKAHGVPVMPSEGQKEGGETKSGVYPYFPDGRRESRSSYSSDLWNDVRGTVRAEIHRSKESVGYALREFARDMVKEIVLAILRSMAPTLSRGFRR